MLATYAASRHRQIVPCCMISSVSHDNVSRLVTDRSMCFATALDKAFENIDCMSAILRCQAKNRFYESTQRLIQPRRVLWFKLLLLGESLGTFCQSSTRKTTLLWLRDHFVSKVVR